MLIPGGQTHSFHNHAPKETEPRIRSKVRARLRLTFPRVYY